MLAGTKQRACQHMCSSWAAVTDCRNRCSRCICASVGVLDLLSGTCTRRMNHLFSLPYHNALNSKHTCGGRCNRLPTAPCFTPGAARSALTWISTCYQLEAVSTLLACISCMQGDWPAPTTARGGTGCSQQALGCRDVQWGRLHMGRKR
jgi:hypothetical protein